MENEIKNEIVLNGLENQGINREDLGEEEMSIFHSLPDLYRTRVFDERV